MLRTIGIVTFSLALTGCGMPRDPAGTMDRIERTGTLRLGMIEGAQMDEPSRQTLAQLLQETAAQPKVTRGDSEKLLEQLKAGELDLVYGELAKNSPWSSEVAFSKAQGMLGKPPKGQAAPRFAMMNGENGWIVAVGKASR